MGESIEKMVTDGRDGDSWTGCFRVYDALVSSIPFRHRMGTNGDSDSIYVTVGDMRVADSPVSIYWRCIRQAETIPYNRIYLFSAKDRSDDSGYLDEQF